MKEKRILTPFSFLVIVYFIFQMMPGPSYNGESLQSHAPKSKIFLPAVSLDATVLHIGKENQKTQIQKILVKNTSISLHQILGIDVSLTNTFFQEEPFDYRKIIRQSISHYFNGTKYKIDRLVI